MVSPDGMRRLAYVRVLLEHARTQCGRQPPYSFAGLGALHDVAEQFLALAATEHHLAPPREFMKYWELLESVLHRPLRHRGAMDRVNRVRTSWKHAGVEPSAVEIQAAVEAVTALISDECQHLLGLNLEDASASTLIEQEQTKALFDLAQSQWDRGEEGEAFFSLSEAFERLLAEAISSGSRRHQTIEDFTFLGSFHQGSKGRDAEFTDKVIKSLKALDDAQARMSLEIDPNDYRRFLSLTPRISHMLNGDVVGIELKRAHSRSATEFGFCSQFVISTAIALSRRSQDEESRDRPREWVQYRKSPQETGADRAQKES